MSQNTVGRIWCHHALALVMVLVWYSGAAAAGEPAGTLQPFLGRWDMTLQAGKRQYSSWLEISVVDGAAQVRMVGRWGHARVLPRVDIEGHHIRFVSPKEEEGRADSDMEFDGTLRGRSLQGTTTAPDGAPWTWRAQPAPELKPGGSLRWGKPISLFNGRDLGGWRLSDTTAKSRWLVSEGTLLSLGQGSDLQTLAKFRDFKLHVEFSCATSSNSGVYLRGRYEVQIEEGTAPEALNQRLGSIYGFLAPSPTPQRQPDQWRAYDITLEGRYVTVVLDGQTIIDRQEIPGPTGGALDSNEGHPGPIYLQGSEEGRVAFRNIIITPGR